MREDGIPTGMYRDMCPRCWHEDKKEIPMRILHETKTYDYGAPTGHNGDTRIAVEWCSSCGTVRHSVGYNPDERTLIYIPGEEDQG